MVIYKLAAAAWRQQQREQQKLKTDSREENCFIVQATEMNSDYEILFASRSKSTKINLTNISGCRISFI